MDISTAGVEEDDIQKQQQAVFDLAKKVVPFQMNEVDETVISLMVPNDAEIVLLGESTHGTDEFYRIRKVISQHLVEQHGFRAVLVEAEWPDIFSVNGYITNSTANTYSSAKEALAQIKGHGKHMWQNVVAEDLVEWMRQYNKSHGFCVDKMVYLFGIDCQQIYRSLQVIYASLSEIDFHLCTELKARLSFFNGHSDDEYDYAKKTVRGIGSEQIPEILQKVLSEWQWDHYERFKRNKVPGIDLLNIEQNLEIIVNAEEYFRKRELEPAGSQVSWNTRDQHMAMTVSRLRERLQNLNPGSRSTNADDEKKEDSGKDNTPVPSAKIVVWAHNSHIGDASATQRGGADFVRNETWNLGQMIRQITKHCYLLGFDTYDGQVTALTSRMERESTKTYTLNKAIDNSLEDWCHKICQQCRCEAFLLHLTNLTITSSDDGSNHESLAYKILHDRIQQRYVGVNYCPDTELKSHYSLASLVGQYDALVFVNTTNALKVYNANELERTGLKRKTKPNHECEMSKEGKRRLMQEYRHLAKSPLPEINVSCLHDNMSLCHFVMTPKSGDYAGGEYHGRLEFPSAYPMAPPSIYMMTPSGRFQIEERICVSFSDYHQELWNPSWGIESVLVGLQSFMQEECPGAIGSIRASSSERRRLANESHAFNMRNPDFVELFVDGNDNEKEHTTMQDVSEEESAYCRYCRESGGELVSPCECKGGNKYVHLNCLAKWQYQAILSQSTHPKYQTDLEKYCNVCQSEFKVKKFSREGLVLVFTGSEMANMIQLGCLLVATESSSKHNLRLMRQYAEIDPSISSRLSYWTSSVFLITETIQRDGGQNELILGVNLTNPLEGPYSNGYGVRACRTLKKVGLENCKQFIGGPVDADSAFLILSVKMSLLSEAMQEEQPGLTRAVVFHDQDLSLWFVRRSVEEAGLSKILKAIGPAFVEARLYWGYAAWNRVQLLGEIARGGWGLATSEVNAWLKPPGQCWADQVKRAVVAGKNDFSYKYEEGEE